MQRGRKCVMALLVAVGIAGTVGFAPEATMAKSRSATTQHTTAKKDDHGRHQNDDHGRHGHGHDDGANHH